MFLKIGLGFWVLGIAFVLANGEDAEQSGTQLDAFIDAGQIRSGTVDGEEELPNWQVIQRTKISLAQESVVDDNLKLRGAVGGLFYYSLPVTSAPHTRIVKFSPVVEEASASYAWGGNSGIPFARLKLGVFFFKYNPDAQNMGEYLYRSSVYPNIVRTGGWYFLGAGYLAQGLHLNLNFLEGALSTDFTVFMEREEEPNYDLSPALLVKYKLGPLELQTGIEFSHLIQAVPSTTSPTNREVGYFFGTDTLARVDTTGGFTQVVDSINPLTNEPVVMEAWRMIYNTSDKNQTDESLQYYKSSEIDFYTHKGTKVMGRASVTPFGSKNSEGSNLQDLKFYTEFILLGLKDYPIFYDDKKKRIPIMMGANIPTFQLLDRLSVEFEYWDHDAPNDQFRLYDAALPIPGSIGGVPDRRLYVQYLQGLNVLPDDYAKEQKKWKWSVLAQKKVSSGVQLFFQVADDHMRIMDFNNKMSYQPVTQDPGDWWYVLRLHFAI